MENRLILSRRIYANSYRRGAVAYLTFKAIPDAYLLKLANSPALSLFVNAVSGTLRQTKSINMKKLLLTIVLCFIGTLTYAQTFKGTTTVSGEYSSLFQEHTKPVSSGFIGVEYFISNRVSIGVGASYADHMRYGVQVNYYAPYMRNSKFYFGILNYVSNCKIDSHLDPQIRITPTLNYNLSDHWTVYGAVANVEAGVNTTFCRVNINQPQVGFLFRF